MSPCARKLHSCIKILAVWYLTVQATTIAKHLTPWGRVIHASANKGTIASDNGLSPVRPRAIFLWTNAGILSIGPIGTKYSKILIEIYAFSFKQGKSEGFESCDRPIVRKRTIWVKIDDFVSRVTLQFDVQPWKTIGQLFYATSSFVNHFVATGELKLELQSGNAKFGSNSTIFRAVWPWNLTYDFEKQ